MNPPSVSLLGMGWAPERPGGLNRYFADLLGALADDGFELSGVVLGPAANPHPVLQVPARHDDPLTRRLSRYASAARVACQDADVVDVHLALYAFLPKLLGWFGDAPIVVHFHGPWADEGLSVGNGAVKASVKRLVEQAVYRNATGVVVLSNAFKRVLVERYRVSPWNVHVIPPGVDLDHFSPGDRRAARAELAIPEEADVALCVRRLVPRMGHEVLLHAWALVARDGPNALLVIAGEGPIRAELESLAANLGISKTTRFVGSVGETPLLRLYRAADVSIVPSTAFEGFGLVVLESLACGTPVIASDVGGLPEALGDFDPTLVVSSGDPDALASRLIAAFDGQRPPSEACRRYAETFSWKRAARAHRHVYKAALAPESQRRLRVVYLDHCARLSGGELALLRMLKGLEDVDAHVILGEDGPLVRRLLDAGISVEVMPLARRARQLRRDRVRFGIGPARSALGAGLYAFRVARCLRRLKPDVVHTNSLKAALYGGVAGRLARVPVAWHIRDRIADDYLSRLGVRIVQALARRLPSAVIANSKTTLSTLGETGISSTVIPSPVELGANRAGKDAGDGFRLGIVGRLAPWKGQHLFLEAFARAFPDGTERASIVGVALFGEHEYEEQLREQADRLGLNGRLEFRGFQDDVSSELDRFDVLVHASVMPEPFGQVVVEAMAAGVPVAAANAGGPAELITDGVDGVLYEPGNPDALAAVMKRLRADKNLRASLSEGGYQKAQQFSPERIALAAKQVYADIAPRTSRRGEDER